MTESNKPTTQRKGSTAPTKAAASPKPLLGSRSGSKPASRKSSEAAGSAASDDGSKAMAIAVNMQQQGLVGLKQSGGMGTGIVANQGVVSLVDPNAPPKYVFNDGYDLQAAHAKVKHLLAVDEPDVEDVSYPQYCEYMNRSTELNNTLTALAARRYANVEVMAVAPQAINALGVMGALTSIDDETGEGDVIEFHTQDALRLFTGFEPGIRADGSRQYPISGAVRVGAALRTVSSVAAKFANPYAEMGLMQIEGLFASLSLELEEVQARHMALIDIKAKRGTHYKVRRSQSPVRIPLGFKSPYGFACADLVGQFDYLARVVQTTSLAGLVTKEEARVDLLHIKTKFRAVFNDIMRMGVLIGKENLSEVSRGDWVVYQLSRGTSKPVSGAAADGTRLDGLGDEAGSEGTGGVALLSGGELARLKRDEAVRLARMQAVHRCESLFGMLPSALLLGEQGPKFVSSKVRVSAEERGLIQQLVAMRSGGVSNMALLG